MNYSFVDFLNLVGALGLFLFGMSMMSEGLQKIAGSKMRSFLASMTTNRFTGVLTGLLITAVIQSSSATTVMVVSFVNAGLLTLVESISVIMGANIGTTVTAWLVSLFGFQFSITTIAIPLIGLSIPFIFSKNDRRHSLGEFIIGFSLLFIGLEYLKNSVPDLQANPEMLQFLTKYTGMGFSSVLLFLFIGTVLTLIVQSSSATMAITLVMLNQQWISFDIAAAMVLGENIGTTITANLAALPANINAKRAALSHTMFNVFGVTWAMVFFYPFTKLVLYVVSLGDPANANNLFALSLFHTMFNSINVCLMIWFVKSYAKVVTRILPDRKKKESEFEMTYLSGNLLSTPELSIVEAEKEMSLFMQRTQKMFAELTTYAYANYNDKGVDQQNARLEAFEEASDKTESRIANYIYDVSGQPISAELRARIRHYLSVVSEVEIIADCCYNMTRACDRRNKEQQSLIDEQKEGLDEMFALVTEHLSLLSNNLVKRPIDEISYDKMELLEKQINALRYRLKQKNIDHVKSGRYSYTAGTHYMDLIEECERIGDSVMRIVEESRH